MVRLSVNINKIATLRNSRGANNPDVVQVALDCEAFGAEGITVHPRPDERHIRYADVYALKDVIQTEFNIEGNPIPKFMEMVLELKPAQVTLVPDDPNQLTSDTGWDTLKHQEYLKDIISPFQSAGIRTSLFINPIPQMIEGAAQTGVDRIEFYTGPYAELFHKNPQEALAPYITCAALAQTLGLGINAGHDLDLNNLRFLKQNLPALQEVSIGHALVCDALYYGLENTIQMYLRQLE